MDIQTIQSFVVNGLIWFVTLVLGFGSALLLLLPFVEFLYLICQFVVLLCREMWRAMLAEIREG